MFKWPGFKFQAPVIGGKTMSSHPFGLLLFPPALWPADSDVVVWVSSKRSLSAMGPRPEALTKVKAPAFRSQAMFYYYISFQEVTSFLC